ncbi:MAG TPA: hypothetical protein VEP90_13370 [Methylomirabilota bacterium]|nr:hypothetical protein [Methylomirabilota bacterium]
MNFILTVTQEELLIISEALGELPFRKVINLIPKLQAQVNEQQSRQTEAKLEEETCNTRST